MEYLSGTKYKGFPLKDGFRFLKTLLGNDNIRSKSREDRIHATDFVAITYIDS